MRAKHPCKRDCPRRTAECKRDCPDWARYAEEKKEEYAERMIQGMIDDTLYKMDRNRTKRGCFLASETKPLHSAGD